MYDGGQEFAGGEMHEVDVQGEEGRVKVAGDKEEGVAEEGARRDSRRGQCRGIA